MSHDTGVIEKLTELAKALACIGAILEEDDLRSEKLTHDDES